MSKDEKINTQIKVRKAIYWEFKSKVAIKGQSLPEALEHAMGLFIEDAKNGEGIENRTGWQQLGSHSSHYFIDANVGDFSVCKRETLNNDSVSKVKGIFPCSNCLKKIKNSEDK